MDQKKKSSEIARLENDFEAAINLGRPPVPAVPSKGRSARVLPESIAYNQTKTIPVPSDVLGRRRVISGLATGGYTHAFKVLRTKILQRLRESNENLLAVTSPRAGAGSTLTAINLAITLTMDLGNTVLLVDCNLGQPAVHAYFGIKPDFGLCDRLTDNVPLSEILINPGIERLVILPGGRPIGRSSEMLMSPQMNELVHEIKNRYQSRIIVFDLPPMFPSDDALAFLPSVDSALLVIEAGRSTTDEVRRAARLIEGAGVRLLGTVLNKC